MTWLLFALMTVFCWGAYGVLLHTGVTAMADPVNGRFKAFLFVGAAYLVVAVLGSLIALKVNNVQWQSLPASGIAWSTIAGVAGPPAPSASCWPSGPEARRPWSCPSSSPGPR